MADDFGLALDKQVISDAAWNALTPEQQTVMQTTFDALETPEYYEVGMKLKNEDLATWRKANGNDSVIQLGVTGLAASLESLNKRLAEEVYGPGAWQMIQSA